MMLKEREEPCELKLMRSLSIRMMLTDPERNRLASLEKGYAGEKKFDRIAEHISEERFLIHDLLLEVNGSYFQIDTLLISQNAVHLLDMKNYGSDCYFEGEKLLSVTSGREYKNPLLQLNRSVMLFRQLLQNLNQSYHVEGSVIFMNPSFTLYHAPTDQPIILPNQLDRFLENLNKTPSKLNHAHKKLAQTLLSKHHPENPFSYKPAYAYHQLRKGIFCGICRSFEMTANRQGFVCKKCGKFEPLESTILRHIHEFILLFPDRKVTTQNIFEWCQTDLSKKTFNRILKKNFTAHGRTSGVYYD